jgi:alkanesulfonate monooxygenase SsuD/methylene tetrahydromethanopterin reductase-like flavin-dependent oxidoreductase (luciferase family)
MVTIAEKRQGKAQVTYTGTPSEVAAAIDKFFAADHISDPALVSLRIIGAEIQAVLERWTTTD